MFFFCRWKLSRRKYSDSLPIKEHWKKGTLLSSASCWTFPLLSSTALSSFFSMTFTLTLILSNLWHLLFLLHYPFRMLLSFFWFLSCLCHIRILQCRAEKVHRDVLFYKQIADDSSNPLMLAKVTTDYCLGTHTYTFVISWFVIF